MNGKKIHPSKWKTLVIPSYVHALVMISVKGFKITKSVFNVDFQLKSLAYTIIFDIERIQKRSFGFDLLVEFQRRKKDDDDAETYVKVRFIGIKNLIPLCGKHTDL